MEGERAVLPGSEVKIVHEKFSFAGGGGLSLPNQKSKVVIEKFSSTFWRGKPSLSNLNSKLPIKGIHGGGGQ